MPVFSMDVIVWNLLKTSSERNSPSNTRATIVRKKYPWVTTTSDFSGRFVRYSRALSARANRSSKFSPFSTRTGCMKTLYPFPPRSPCSLSRLDAACRFMLNGFARKKLYKKLGIFRPSFRSSARCFRRSLSPIFTEIHSPKEMKRKFCASSVQRCFSRSPSQLSFNGESGP